MSSSALIQRTKNQADTTQRKTPGQHAVIKLRADRVLKGQLILSSVLKYYLASSGGVKFGEKILIYFVYTPVFSPNLPCQTIAANVFQQAVRFLYAATSPSVLISAPQWA